MTAKAFAIFFAVVLVIGGLVTATVATQGFGFFLSSRQNNFSNHLFQHSYGTETGDQTAMASDFKSLYVDANAYGWNSPAVKGDANDICQIAAAMEGGGFSLVPYSVWVSHHCANGSLINTPSAH